MSPLHRLIGMLYAAGVGAGLWFLWPEARALLKGTWLNDLWIPAMIIHALLGIWIAERIWAMITPLFGSKSS